MNNRKKSRSEHNKKASLLAITEGTLSLCLSISFSFEQTDVAHNVIGILCSFQKLPKGFAPVKIHNLYIHPFTDFLSAHLSTAHTHVLFAALAAYLTTLTQIGYNKFLFLTHSVLGCYTRGILCSAALMGCASTAATYQYSCLSSNQEEYEEYMGYSWHMMIRYLTINLKSEIFQQFQFFSRNTQYKANTYKCYVGIRIYGSSEM